MPKQTTNQHQSSFNEPEEGDYDYAERNDTAIDDEGYCGTSRGTVDVDQTGYRGTTRGKVSRTTPNDDLR